MLRRPLGIGSLAVRQARLGQGIGVTLKRTDFLSMSFTRKLLWKICPRLAFNVDNAALPPTKTYFMLPNRRLLEQLQQVQLSTPVSTAASSSLPASSYCWLLFASELSASAHSVVVIFPAKEGSPSLGRGGGNGTVRVRIRQTMILATRSVKKNWWPSDSMVMKE